MQVNVIEGAFITVISVKGSRLHEDFMIEKENLKIRVSSLDKRPEYPGERPGREICTQLGLKMEEDWCDLKQDGGMVLLIASPETLGHLLSEVMALLEYKRRQANGKD